MKKFVRIVSLSVALCLCCCFSTFGSVKASAYTSYDFFPATVDNEIYFNSSSVYSGIFNSSSNIYSYNNSALTTDRFYSRFNDEPWSIAVNTDIYDYYFISSVYAPCSDISNFTYFPTNLAVYSYDHSNNTKELDISNINIYHLDTVTYKGFSVSCKVDLTSDSNIGFIAYSTGFVSGTIPANLNIEYQVLSLPKSLSNGDLNAAVVSAINNQTNHLSSDIGQAADDIQQSIEDQYQMEDEEDFGFSDIQEQYEEKMGVLTFGTETTLQMLDLFSPSNAGEAYIRVPGWSMDIQGETYNIWNEYTFYFSWIEDWIPMLVRLMRTFNVTMFYIAILMYINKVYERNFLAK